MIAAFKIPDSFSHTPDFSALVKNCHHFTSDFPTVGCEYFYYIKPAQTDRYFFIRAKTKDTKHFVAAVKSFADNLNFEILPKLETNSLLYKIKLDEFR